jgi:hypothetical protein
VHLHLQRVGRGRRRPLAPERVDQAVARDDLVRAQEQAREQRRVPPGAERDGALAVDNLQRSEDAELRLLPPPVGRRSRS